MRVLVFAAVPGVLVLVFVLVRVLVRVLLTVGVGADVLAGCLLRGAFLDFVGALSSAVAAADRFRLLAACLDATLLRDALPLPWLALVLGGVHVKRFMVHVQLGLRALASR